MKHACESAQTRVVCMHISVRTWVCTVKTVQESLLLLRKG